jgi:uncharacterized coiled-coil DUF342 family protein
MDSIKKKMITLSSATEEANARAERFAEETRRISEIADRSGILEEVVQIRTILDPILIRLSKTYGFRSGSGSMTSTSTICMAFIYTKLS